MEYSKINKKLIVGIILTAIVIIPVILGFFWQPYDVNSMDYSAVLQKPSLSHIFGTDNFGRDIYSRVVSGAGTTFLIAVLTISIGAVIGTVVGALTGYFGGIVDEILMRVNDGLASFPSILLALVVVSILDTGTFNICIALGLVFIPSFARIMRGEFMAEKEKDYVLNAKLMGAGDFRIIFVHILPNTFSILFSSLLVGFNNAVLAEAGLSYLGLGVQPPDPSLGRMLSEAQVYIFSAPWYVIVTCAVMVTAILGITIISENIGVSGINLRAVRKKAEQIRLARENNAVPARYKEVPVLSVRGLEVGFADDYGFDLTLKGVSFDLGEKEILGIVGESGSGKSLSTLAVMGILPDKACVTAGSISYRGMSLLELKNEEYRKLRGKNIAMIFQEPMTSLNPVKTIGWQIDEVLDLHMSEMPEKQQREKVLEALDDVGLEDGEKLYDMYPHELSGGMRQRVMIAMALVAEADVIIADEPTTALDADVAEVILDIFKKINRKYGTSIVLISHDLRVISRICNRAIVMKDGEIIEELDVFEEMAGKNSPECFEAPVQEYTKNLLNAAFSTKRYTGEFDLSEAENIVTMRNFNVFYKNRTGSGVFRKKELKQVNFDISLDILKGQTVGLVGASGCGKSTLVKAIAGLQQYTSGEMKLNCERPAMVFQDPYSSLNPAKNVGWLLEEPLRISSKKTKEQRKEKVKEILLATGLDEEVLSRSVAELSGGQRQRIAIALTMIQHKDLIILDEPVSALDVTIQEQILELLMRLKQKYNLTYILISHDKRLVERVCDKVYTMKDGRI